MTSLLISGRNKPRNNIEFALHFINYMCGLMLNSAVIGQIQDVVKPGSATGEKSQVLIPKKTPKIFAPTALSRGGWCCAKLTSSFLFKNLNFVEFISFIKKPSHHSCNVQRGHNR